MMAKWAPPAERGKLAGVAFSGCTFGIIVTLPISGVLVARFGWEMMFYTFGIVSCLWIPFFWLLSADRPDELGSINQAELDYLNSVIGTGWNQIT